MISRRALLFAPAPGVAYSQSSPTKMFANAQAYDRFMGRWSRQIAPTLVEFAGLRDGMRVLDVGSGTGSLTFAIAARDSRSQVMGIDPSNEYVDYAARQNRFGERVRFQEGDAQALQFEARSFDAAVSLFVFNFIPDYRKALAEARRVTRPGGMISAAVWDYGDGMRMLRAFWDAAVKLDPAVEKRDERHMPLCRRGELSALWRQGGLEAVAEQPIEMTMRFPSFADYWDAFLLGQGPAGSYAASLDGGRRERLRGELARVLGDGSLDLPARAWAVRGTAA